MQVARTSSVLAVLAVTAASPAAAQLTIRLHVPITTPGDAPVHVAGNFNGWNPASPEHVLERSGDALVLTLPATLRGAIEFKFTLGSWDSVETAADGSDIENRSVVIAQGATTHEATVAAWRTGPAAPRPSTRTASVTVIPEFEVPQLNGTRRVWVYLPPDYATSNKRYPVLYMHDGQNVFDEATSFAGEWGVDETLDSLHAAGDRGAIVIAVDHGGQTRINEYSPWPTRFGDGRGEAYTDFIVQTLKPWADRTYRTLPDRAHTGIAGSSMGGLISFYALLKYPEVFGRAGVFSPAFWIAPAAFEMAARTERPRDVRMYMISGALEGAPGEHATYQRDQQRMAAALAARGFKSGRDLVATIAPDGRHSEWFWRREFAAAYQWLFNSKSK